MRSIVTSRLLGVILLAGVMLAGPSVLAQEFVGMKGRLTDAEGKPLEGYRAVFLPVMGDGTFVSGVSDKAGNYIVSLRLGGKFVPVALVTPNGGRIELSPGQPVLEVRRGGGLNIQLQPGALATTGKRDVVIGGKITDVEGEPLTGYRIVFRLDDEIILSSPSLDNGEYTVTLPERKLLSPLAACSSNGLRFPLEEPPLQPRANGRRDFSLPVRSPALFEPAFAGADRLFLSFAEDPATTAFIHEQTQADLFQLDSQGVLVSRLILAAQLPGLADTEIGLTVGYGSYDPAIGPDISGMTDLDIWAKLNLGPAVDGTEYATGFLMTIPTGEETPGLGADAWATKIFASGRRAAGRGVLSANIGLRITGDGMIQGRRLHGRFSGSVAMGWVAPVHPNVNFILEGAVETERYDDVDPEFQLLTGFNIAVHEVSIRLAVAGGLTDSSPDYRFLAGLAIEF